MKNHIVNSALYWALFNRFELRLPGEAVNDICQPGQNDEAVAFWTPRVIAQIAKDSFNNRPTDELIIKELSEYGAWNDDELKDTEQNWKRLVWCAAWNIAEQETPDCSDPVLN